MAAKKKPKKASSGPSLSAPLDFTEEHVRMAREGRGKEVFERLLAKKPSGRESKE